MKPELLLLHGALGSKLYLKPLKDRLSKQFTVYDLDFEGHGANEGERPFSIQLFTNNVVSFLKANNLSGIAVFGYSMGGYVALTVALQHPKLIKSIATLGTKLDWNPDIASKEIKMLNPAKIVEKVPRFASYLEKLHVNNDWKQVMHKTALLMRDLGEGKGLKPVDFKQISQSVSIAVGGEDKMVSKAESQAVAEYLPNGTFLVLPEIEHPIEKIPVEIIEKYIITELES